MATLTEFVLLPWREATRTALAGASQGGSQVLTHCWSQHLRTRLFSQYHCIVQAGAV